MLGSITVRRKAVASETVAQADTFQWTIVFLSKVSLIVLQCVSGGLGSWFHGRQVLTFASALLLNRRSVEWCNMCWLFSRAMSSEIPLVRLAVPKF